MGIMARELVINSYILNSAIFGKSYNPGILYKTPANTLIYYKYNINKEIRIIYYIYGDFFYIIIGKYL